MTARAAMRWQVRQQRPVAYDIVASPGLFERHNTALLTVGRPAPSRRFVVLDSNCARHHGEKIRAWFAAHNLQARIVLFPGGEENKTLDHYCRLARELDCFPIHRRDEPVIAIGGGVLTDLVGFLASSYRRGLPHIKVPTTLMGYVDAAVGVKTGVNFNGHKNRLGSFEPPAQVLLDPGFLATLPERHLRNGVCEIIKLAVIADADLFELLEKRGRASMDTGFQDAAGAEILNRAIAGMLGALTPNLFEDELARAVDFGHTFSYGLETHHEKELLHGEAVLLDILVCTRIAAGRSLLSRADARRIHGLLDTLGVVPELAALDIDLMWQALEDRTCHRNGQQRVPLPAGLGRCRFVNDITPAELAAAVHTLMKETHDPAYEY